MTQAAAAHVLGLSCRQVKRLMARFRRQPERWLIRQTHDERQGNIQPRNIPIVKMADPPSDSFAPDRDGLFTGDMAQQGRKLMTMINVAVSGLNDLDALVPAVQALGRRHAGYGVTAGHSATVGAALWTLQKGLGDGFTRDVNEAWAATYGLLASPMTNEAAIPVTV